jgi:predicted RNase H-like nuclease (RuvC/YqgF family)
MLTAKDDLSENNCPDCAFYLKEIADLKEAGIEVDYESVRQITQLKDEISELNDECSYAYRLLEDYKAEIERLKAEHSQSKKKVLEEVEGPQSNTTLRARF